MPELPEVEVVRRGLARWVPGSSITSVEVFHPRPVRRHLAGPQDFAARLRAARVHAVERRGKFLWLVLDRGDALLAHLGMSGQLLLQLPQEPAQSHLRVRIGLAGRPDLQGRELRFVDQRMFGGLAVVPMLVPADGPEPIPVPVAHIARDLLDPRLDEPELIERLRRRKTGIKRALLDQTLVSGVGNIYADEGLWRARMHYARPTDTLTRPAARRVLTELRAVMTRALAAGGTSFDSLYVDVNGSSGYFDRSLAVYGQAGRPCPRCGTPIRRDVFMNRSSFTCPRCQPRPRRARW